MAAEGILFLLAALNGPALDIIDHGANPSYRIDIQGRRMLGVGLYVSPKVPGRLLSLGRNPATNDLILRGPKFSMEHCHFYFNRSSPTLILRDTSSARSTKISYPNLDDDRVYQLQGNPRRRALLTTHHIIMDVGPAQFQIIWQVPNEPSAIQALEQAKVAFAQRQVAPELDLTLRDPETLPPTAYEVQSGLTPRVALQYQRQPTIVHEKLCQLGKGTFGTVHKTVDLDTGDLFAVKISNKKSKDIRHKLALKREVELLAKLSHPNIVRFMHSQGWTDKSEVEIFMSLHEGSLLDLISPHKCDDKWESEPYFFALLGMQVLSAMAYLHGEGIIHRDIKPGNILYDHKGKGSSLTFYISDFGLSKEQNAISSPSFAGSFIYVAPEINQGMPHTSKCDIWSFAVMMLVVLGYFCKKEVRLPPEEWKNQMARLPGYRSDFTFERDLGPAVSLSAWENQLRWYGRLRSLVQYQMVPQVLLPLLAEDAGARPNAQQCLTLFSRRPRKEQPAPTPKNQQPKSKDPIHTLLGNPRIEKPRPRTRAAFNGVEIAGNLQYHERRVVMAPRAPTTGGQVGQAGWPLG